MESKYFFKYFSNYVVSKFYDIFAKKPKVMSSADTIDYILKNRCSIARFGDGELRLMCGIDLEFQQYAKELSNKLKSVKTNEKCLACIPSVFNKELFNDNILIRYEYEYWKSFLKKRGGLWKKYFSNQSPLGDAFLSRFYYRYKDKSVIGEYLKKLKLLWENRDIVFVEGKNSCLGCGNDLFDNAKSIKRIICPPVNAFKYYEEIKASILKECKKDDLVIMALGPTATVLAYELSDVYQCLDLGHVDIEYEWFLNGSGNKVSVQGKYVNETKDGRNPTDNTDDKYLKQIIAKIGAD